MSLILQTILYFFLFGAGFILRQRAYVNKGHAAFLLKIVVNVALPLLIMGSVNQVNITQEFALLPISAMIISLFTGLIGYTYVRSRMLVTGDSGVLIVSAMIMNLSLVYPYIQIVIGKEGIARLIMFDLGNAIMAFTIVYMVAAYYGKGSGRIWQSIKLLLRFPPFLTLLLALVMKLFDVTLSDQWLDICLATGTWLILCVFPALGIYFVWRDVDVGMVIAGISLRILVGAILGLGIAFFAPLDPVSMLIVITASMAPVGFNAVVFAAEQDLNHSLAANIASISLLLAMVYLPIIIFFTEKNIIISG